MIIKRPVRRRAGSKEPALSIFCAGAATGLVADVPAHGSRCGVAAIPAGTALARIAAGLR
jgi:hypothetical protein